MLSSSMARPCPCPSGLLAIVVLFMSSCLFQLVSAVESAAGMPAAALPPKYVPVNANGRRDVLITCVNGNNKKVCDVTCPRRCRNKCVGMCPSCKTYCLCDLFPGVACGDPRFVGADGNIFYFHGKKDQDFCILSDTDLHINAHFIGKPNPEKSRDFTWIQALGIVFGNGNGNVNHKLYIGVEKTVTWDDSVDHLLMSLDGEQIHMPTEANAKWVPDLSSLAAVLSITRTSDTNAITVELSGIFTIIANAVPITKEESNIHNYGVMPDDSLAHLDLSFKFHSLTDDVHGVLGQTHRPDYVNNLDVTKKMPLMTGAANYSSSSIFATDCAVARFHGNPQNILMLTAN